MNQLVTITANDNHKKYHNQLKTLLSRPTLLRTYNRLANQVTANLVDPHINAFFEHVDRTKPGVLLPGDKAFIRSKVRIVSVREFKDHIAKCMQWLKQNVNGRPYGIIMVSDLKSSTWLAAVAAREMGYPPMMLVDSLHERDFEFYANERPENQDAHLRQYIRYIDRTAKTLGVRDWIYLDDGVYSGSQISRVLGPLFTDEEYFKKKEYVKGKVWVAAAFCGPEGREVLDLLTNKKKNKITYYCAGHMESIKNMMPPDMAKRLSKLNNNGWHPGRTLTIMPYKVPNHFSFGFFHAGKPLVPNTLAMPPYKRLKRKRPSESTGTTRRR